MGVWLSYEATDMMLSVLMGSHLVFTVEFYQNVFVYFLPRGPWQRAAEYPFCALRITGLLLGQSHVNLFPKGQSHDIFKSLFPLFQS